MMWALCLQSVQLCLHLAGGEPGHGECQRGKGLWAGYQNGVGHGAPPSPIAAQPPSSSIPPFGKPRASAIGMGRREGWDAASRFVVYFVGLSVPGE